MLFSRYTVYCVDTISDQFYNYNHVIYFQMIHCDAYLTYQWYFFMFGIQYMNYMSVNNGCI